MSLPEPVSRRDMYLSNIAGEETELPEPVSREDQYLKYIAEHGGGGGTSNYNNLDNKPKINGVTLQGNKTTQELLIHAGGSDVFDDYETAVDEINAWLADHRGIGDNVYIRTQEVPDLWVSGVEEESVPYEYTDDDAITTALAVDGYVQFGFYKLSALETQKVVIPQYETKELTFTKDDDTTETITFMVQ